MSITYELENKDGTAADPRTFRTAVPTGNPGDTIRSAGRTLGVIDTRLDEGPDGDPVALLVVEPAYRLVE
jgi:hypothetical protein